MSKNRLKKLPEGQVIPLMQDFMFSGIFNDENNIDIVEMFIGQYFRIPIDEVKGNIKIKNRELSINNKSERNKQIDLLIKYNGDLINVEINNQRLSQGVIDRNLVFACHTHGTQLKYSDNDYSHIKKTVQINFNKSNGRLKKSRIKYLMIDSDIEYFSEENVLSNDLEIYMLDVEKESKLWYSGTSKDAISMWCSLLNASTEAEIAAIMESEIMESVPEKTKNKLVDEINKYSEDEEFIGLYNISSKEECAWNSALREAKEEATKEGHEKGFEKGIEEGRKKGIKEGMQEGIKEGKQAGREEKCKEDAINLYNNGVSKEIICKSLQITDEELASYLDC